MNRAKLINRLVARKMKSPGKTPICICMPGTSAMPRRALAKRKN